MPSLTLYVEKLREIVSTVVTDEVENFGRLKKIKECETDPVKQRPKKNIKTTEHKQWTSENKEISEDDDAISINSCDSDEKEFTTLTGADGTEYYPPSSKKIPSRYAKKGHTSSSSGDDSLRKLASLKNHMEKQNSEIRRLRQENEQNRKKLNALRKKEQIPTNTSKGQNGAKKSSSASQFVSGTLASVLDSDNDSDVQEIGNKPSVEKADSTSPKGLLKKSEVSALSDKSGSSDNDDQVPSSQIPPWQKRPRRCIESVSSNERHREPSLGFSAAQQTGVEDPDEETDELRCQKDILQERFLHLEQQLLQQRMENQARSFREDITGGVRELRSALMGAYGENIDSNESVCNARRKLGEVCKTRQSLGYTFRVHTEFVDRVEKSILCGFVPEQQIQCTKTDNSCLDPILGDVVDVIYELAMPMVIKPEVNEDDDILIVGETPATGAPFQFVTVKQERPEKTPEELAKNTQEERTENTEEERTENTEEECTENTEEQSSKQTSENTRTEDMVSEDNPGVLQKSGETGESETPDVATLNQNVTQEIEVESASQEWKRKRKREEDGSGSPSRHKRKKHILPWALQRLT